MGLALAALGRKLKDDLKGKGEELEVLVLILLTYYFRGELERFLSWKYQSRITTASTEGESRWLV